MYFARNSPNTPHRRNSHKNTHTQTKASPSAVCPTNELRTAFGALINNTDAAKRRPRDMSETTSKRAGCVRELVFYFSTVRRRRCRRRRRGDRRRLRRYCVCVCGCLHARVLTLTDIKVFVFSRQMPSGSSNRHRHHRSQRLSSSSSSLSGKRLITE